MLKIYEEEALQFECNVIKAIGPFIEEVSIINMNQPWEAGGRTLSSLKVVKL